MSTSDFRSWLYRSGEDGRPMTFDELPDWLQAHIIAGERKHRVERGWRNHNARNHQGHPCDGTCVEDRGSASE